MFHSIAVAFHEGGWGMYPILLFLILILAFAVERFVFLFFKARINKEAFISALEKLILQGDVPRAIKLCNATEAPMARILKAGLMRANKSDEEVQAAMDEASLREIPKIEKRTQFLAMFGNTAVLAGLLGMVAGMIKSFASVAGVDASKKAELLASGISEVMNCTAFGLGTAIFGLLAFAILQNLTQHILDDINEATVRVLNLVVNNRDRMNLQGQERV
jgi:biopolymer transport protein ExbB/TolQ